MCVCVGNKHKYVYTNIISTGLYTTFTGGDKVWGLIWMTRKYMYIL